MTSGVRHAFHIRPHDAEGQWASNARRYRRFAHELLSDLERICAEISALWPAQSGTVIGQDAADPELWRRCEIRNRTSESVRIYAAMAIEGFLNFYGVVRLGQRVFDGERLATPPCLPGIGA
jgi:hypothetical protein